MTWFVVDIEADGPAPGMYSMIEIGAVALNRDGDVVRFYGALKPISENYMEDALKAINKTREQTIDDGEDPLKVMTDFENWIKENSKGRPIFISDNNGFDWMFVCWYFWKFLGRNPFGFSSANINSIYKGLTKNMWASFKELRKTKHDHNPVNDATGNLEALLHMKDVMGLNINLHR